MGFIRKTPSRRRDRLALFLDEVFRTFLIGAGAGTILTQSAYVLLNDLTELDEWRQLTVLILTFSLTLTLFHFIVRFKRPKKIHREGEKMIGFHDGDDHLRRGRVVARGSR